MGLFRPLSLALTLCLAAASTFCAAQHLEADIVVYGGTAAGVTAAIQTRAMGRTVILAAPEQHVGGMSVEGLGSSDINNHWFRNDIAVGGLAREFYRRVGARYGAKEPVYKFESSVAEAVFEHMLRDTGVQVIRGRRLREPLRSSVVWQGGSKRVRALRMEDGSEFAGRYFVDATIEGDLLAAAGVTTVIGREANAKYGETKKGIRGINEYRQFPFKVDPYREPGNPASGLLPTIQDEPLGEPGSEDHRLQGYCFRLCLTKRPENQIAIRQPANYHRSQYQLYLRYAQQGGTLIAPVANFPNEKTDLGSWHDLSANLYGMNHGYAGGTYAERQKIYDYHRDFTHGLMYFLANDPELPQETRERWRGAGGASL